MNVEGTLQSRIETKLRAALDPIRLDVINESHNHAVGPQAETHFKVVVTSGRFQGSSLLQRHREIYRILADELAAGVHALALHTYSPDEDPTAPNSPNCLGGSKR